MTTLSGKAFYTGYLTGCTVFLDLNGNEVQDEAEISASTTDFGAFTFAPMLESTLSQSTAHVMVKPSAGCIDVSTGLALPVALKVEAACANVGLITTVQTMIAAGLDNAEDIVNYGLTASDTFDACVYDPFSYVWDNNAANGARRRLDAGATFKNYVTVNMEIAAVVKTLSDVTGYASDDMYAQASQAILQGIATEFEQKYDDQTPGLITFATTQATTELIDAAEAATDVEISEEAQDTLANAATELLAFVKDQVATVSDQAAEGEAVTALSALAKSSAVSQAVVDTSELDNVADLIAAVEANTDEGKLDEKYSVQPVPDDRFLQQAASPSPPPPSPSPSPPPPKPPPPSSSPPPPQPPLRETNEKTTTDGSDTSALFALFVLVLILPIFFAVYVLIKYNGQECKYLSWRFSHTNPFIVCGYMPKERRDALWRELQAANEPQVASKSPPQGATLVAEKFEKESIQPSEAGPSQAPAGAGIDPATGKQYRV